MSWTSEASEMAATLWKQGLSASEIADRLPINVSRSAVLGKINRMGLMGRTLEGKPIGNAPKRRRRQPRAKKAEPVKRHFPTYEVPRPSASEWQRDTLTTLAEIEPCGCRYVVGDPRGAETVMCGAEKIPGLSYCLEHARVVYRPPNMRKTPAKKLETV